MTAEFALLSTAIDVPVYVVLALNTVSVCHWTLPSSAQ
jgi:hypothetical protein